MPVKLNGKIGLGQSYYLAKVLFSPDSVDIYARRDVLDSIKYVYTERLSIVNLTDTVIRQIPLQKHVA